MSKQKNIQLTSYSDEFLTRNQVAKLFKCSVNTITRLTKQGISRPDSEYKNQKRRFCDHSATNP